MEKTEAFRLITRQFCRGVILFKLLQFASMIGGGVALIFPVGRPWGLAAFVGAILFGVARVHVRATYLSAVSQDLIDDSARRAHHPAGQ
jgi:uncharacterized membrane protein